MFKVVKIGIFIHPTGFSAESKAR